jgi:hypothetical protein
MGLRMGAAICSTPVPVEVYRVAVVL